jgi:hypothetical protein
MDRSIALFYALALSSPGACASTLSQRRAWRIGRRHA